jgi:drug/metabolite transporter (DMT)-like permease
MTSRSPGVRDQKKAYLYALVAIFFWATIPSAFKLGLRATSPATLLFWANATSLAAFLAVIVITGRTKLLLLQSSGELLHSALLGILSPFGYYLILFEAYSRLPGQIAQPLNMIWPLVLVYLSAVMLGQKISGKSYLALLISFTGIFFVSSRGDLLGFGHTDITGVVLAAGSSVIWAFFWILHMKDTRQEVIALFTNFFFAFLYITLFLAFTDNSFVPPPAAVAAGIYAGLFEMGFTFLIWLKALQLAKNTATISNLVYLAPFLSLFFIHQLVGEKIYPTTVIGLILIIGGIFVQNYFVKKTLS